MRSIAVLAFVLFFMLHPVLSVYASGPQTNATVTAQTCSQETRFLNSLSPQDQIFYKATHPQCFSQQNLEFLANGPRGLVNAFQAGIASFLGTLNSISLWVLGILATVSLVLYGIRTVLGDDPLPLVGIFKQLVVLLLFYGLVDMAPELGEGIIYGFQWLGGQISLSTLNSARQVSGMMGSGGAVLASFLPTQAAADPGTIFSQGLHIGTVIMGSVSGTATHWYDEIFRIGPEIESSLAGIMVMVCFALIAAELAWILIETYMIQSFSCLVFAISVVEPLRGNVLHLVNVFLGQGFKVLGLYAALSLGTFMFPFIEKTAADGGGGMTAVLTILGYCLIYLLIALKAPSIGGILFPGAGGGGLFGGSFLGAVAGTLFAAKSLGAGTAASGMFMKSQIQKSPLVGMGRKGLGEGKATYGEARASGRSRLSAGAAAVKTGVRGSLGRRDSGEGNRVSGNPRGGVSPITPPFSGISSSEGPQNIAPQFSPGTILDSSGKPFSKQTGPATSRSSGRGKSSPPPPPSGKRGSP